VAGMEGQVVMTCSQQKHYFNFSVRPLVYKQTSKSCVIPIQCDNNIAEVVGSTLHCPISSFFGLIDGFMVKVIGCSSLRGGGGELGTNKNLDLWLQLVCTKLKLKHAI